jgi:hypothetical protein
MYICMYVLCMYICMHRLYSYYCSYILWLYHSIYLCKRAWGSVVGWGIMLQAGRSRFRFPILSLDFFKSPNPSSRNITLGRLRNEYQESSWGAKGRSAREADNLPLSVSRFSRKCGRLDVSQSYGPSRPDTGTALPSLHLFKVSSWV